MELQRKLNNGAAQCLACSHYCAIAPGKSGICGVRKNEGGELKLLVYGRPCASNIDPIEKKPFYHFLPGTKVLSLGTFGCNLRCSFCQNWDISQLTRRGGVVRDEEIDWQKLLTGLEYCSPAEAAEKAVKNNLPAIAYTYNEPTIWSEYAVDIAKQARASGLKNVYVSNGYLSKECCDFIAPWIDAINIDLKSFREDFYERLCGGKLQPVLETIKRLRAAGVWVEITTLIIPRENDTDEELKMMADFIASVGPEIPWHLSAFHGDYQMAERPATGRDALVRAERIGREAGLKYVYIGNVEAKEYGNTYCPACGELVIERGYMSAAVKNFKKGKCGKCGEKIAGVF